MNKISKKTGFSLLEVMVALSLLMITMSSTMALMANNFNTIAEAKNKIIARYLAQEAIEYIRKARDDNSFENPTAPNKWLDDLPNCTGGPGTTCGIDVYDKAGAGDVKSCGFYNSCKIKFESTSGKYGHNNGNDTIFKREINIIKTGFEEAEITVIISWKHMGADRSFVLIEHIFNYKTL